MEGWKHLERYNRMDSSRWKVGMDGTGVSWRQK